MFADKEFWTICLVSNYNANSIAYNDVKFKRGRVILYNITIVIYCILEGLNERYTRKSSLVYNGPW
jgi:hypothetical protein